MSPKLSALLLSPTLLIGCATDDLAPTFEDTEAYLDREVLVSIADNGDGVASMQIEKDFGLSTIAVIEEIGVTRLLIDGGEDEAMAVKAMVNRLEGDHRIKFAEPNYLARSMAGTNDSYVSYQWNLEQVNAEEAWQYSTGAGTVVAVLDTGVSSGPDGLTNLLQGYDFYYNDSDPSDRDGHGTFVAGTIAQNTNNNTGVAGLAFNASILPVKVLGDNGYGDINAISNGIVYAANQGADVINMSLGSAYPSSTMESACQYAYNQGTVVVAATGNEYASSIGYPAAYDTVIAVGSSRVDGSRPAYSNYGSGIDLLAPGGDLSKDQNGDGYADGVLQETIQSGRWTYTFWEGTSMATPHVAAAAAMLKSYGVTDPDDVYTALVSTATDVGSAGYDTQNGYGVLNVAAALDFASGGNADDDTSSGGDNSSDGSSGESEGSTGADTTAPNITSVSGYTQGRRFTVEWVTNEPADTYLNFEDYGAYGDDDLTTSHSITLTGSRNETYYFDIESTDEAGNTGTAGTCYISL
jgi:serine protease